MFALAAKYGTIDLMDEVMAVYRVHGERTWSSLPVLTRLQEASRMLKALDEHLDFRYTSTIRQTLAQSYFDMACLARRDGARAEVGKYLFNCLLGGGWRLPGNKRGRFSCIHSHRLLVQDILDSKANKPPRLTSTETVDALPNQQI